MAQIMKRKYKIYYMFYFRKLLKIILKLLSIILILIIVYGFSAFVLPKITINKNTKHQKDIDIFLLSNGVHTDIVLPVKTKHINWRDYVSSQHTLANDTTKSYIAFGWGDKGFYLETPEWKDLKPKVAFNAAFGLGSTAMHTTFYNQLKENKHCKKISINHEQYNMLKDYILDTFKKDENNQFLNIPTTAVYGLNDAFYEAKGRYSLFFTCNTWTNNALKICKQKACLWTPHDKGILSKYP